MKTVSPNSLFGRGERTIDRAKLKFQRYQKKNETMIFTSLDNSSKEINFERKKATLFARQLTEE